jgi:hypothetical protein
MFTRRNEGYDQKPWALGEAQRAEPSPPPVVPACMGASMSSAKNVSQDSPLQLPFLPATNCAIYAQFVAAVNTKIGPKVP